MSSLRRFVRVMPAAQRPSDSATRSTARVAVRVVPLYLAEIMADVEMRTADVLTPIFRTRKETENLFRRNFQLACCFFWLGLLFFRYREPLP
jgi:hypothetical protein